jgi:hypothetical protein
MKYNKLLNNRLRNKKSDIYQITAEDELTVITSLNYLPGQKL